jgi:TonB family protein
MNTAESWILAWLLNSLWQIPLVFCGASLAAWVARPLGPRFVHRVWVGALVLMAVLPACRFDISGLWPGLWHTLVWIGGASASAGEARIVIGPARAAGMASPWFPQNLLAATAALYLAGVLYFAGRLIWGLRKTQAIRREAHQLALPHEEHTRVARLRRVLGLDSGAVDLATSEEISGPATVGLRHRTLLLPPGFVEALSPNDFDALLAHELAHMRRHDFAKNLLYGLLSVPAAYHPVLWLARARVDQTRELACDEMAGDALGGRQSYAHSLLRLAALLSNRGRPRILHAIGILDANSFERRIMHLTRTHLEIGTKRRALVAAACGLLAIATCTSALALHMEVSQKPAHSNVPVKVKAEALKPVNKVPPVYPQEAKQKHETLNGKVLLDVIVGKDGAVENIKVAKSLREDYDRSAIDAVRQWTFQPFLLNGQPIEVATQIGITYSLSR